MNKSRFAKGPVVALLCVVFLLSRCQPVSASEPIHIEALLIWGTNDPMSPDPRHVPVDPKLARKLARGPYRWKYYYQVNRVLVSLAPGETRKAVKMSSKCSLDMSNPDDGRIEVTLHGDGKKISKHVEPFPKGKVFIMGGDAKNETAWFVALTRIEAPPKGENTSPK